MLKHCCQATKTQPYCLFLKHKLDFPRVRISHFFWQRVGCCCHTIIYGNNFDSESKITELYIKGYSIYRPVCNEVVQGFSIASSLIKYRVLGLAYRPIIISFLTFHLQDPGSNHAEGTIRVQFSVSYTWLLGFSLAFGCFPPTSTIETSLSFLHRVQWPCV